MGISGNTFVPPPHPSSLFGSLDNTKDEVGKERFRRAHIKKNDE
jgi:hypothetical protein